jgi:hypothetical protein
LWRRYGRGAQIAAIIVGVVGIVGMATLIGFWMWPSGFVLTITPPVGGTILADGINCGTARADCTATLAKGTTIELRAEPDAGFIFGGFTGDCVQNGRTSMSAARTCGATFNRVAETRREVMHVLTVVKPEHGTIIGPGIQCGLLGSECAAEHPQGMEITLKAYADEGFRSQGFTGDCLKNGDTVMTGPRKCAVTFVQRAVANVSPRESGPITPIPRDTTPTRSSRGTQTSDTPDPMDGRRTPADPPSADKDHDGKPDTPARPSPESIAKDEIQKLLNAYRTAYERLDVDGIKRVYPTAPLAGLRRAFNDYKAAEYTYTGEPEFIDLDPALGTATIKVGALLTPQYKGPKSPPQKLLNLFKVARHDGNWTIRELSVQQK